MEEVHLLLSSLTSVEYINIYVYDDVCVHNDNEYINIYVYGDVCVCNDNK